MIRLEVVNPTEVMLLDETGTVIARCNSKRPDKLENGLKKLVDAYNILPDLTEGLEMAIDYLEATVEQKGKLFESSTKVKFLKNILTKAQSFEEFHCINCSKKITKNLSYNNITCSKECFEDMMLNSSSEDWE